MQKGRDCVSPMQMEQAVERYADMIYRIALHYTQSDADAQDIVQEVFLRWLTKAPLFSDSEHEKAWIIRVSMNLCKDLQKSAWRKRILPQQEIVSPTQPTQKILPLLRSLAPRQRMALYLYYYEEIPVKQIAVILKARENTVMSWLHRGREALREKLKGEIEDVS